VNDENDTEPNGRITEDGTVRVLEDGTPREKDGDG
jgi:hypothetical protein